MGPVTTCTQEALNTAFTVTALHPSSWCQETSRVLWSSLTCALTLPLSAMNFLPPEEQLLYRSCEAKSVKWHNDRKDGLCQCQFMNTTGHSRVALVSLPGSGNTWLRGLLERATSVCTGSLFCDKTLRAGGMCGEGLREGVLVVKTHDTRLQWTNVAYRNGMWSDTRPFFDAAIVLVRSPFRALIAEWNRQNAYRFSSGQMGNSHVKYLESSKFFCELLTNTAHLDLYNYLSNV